MKNYSVIVRFRMEIERLKNELIIFEIQIIKKREKYNSYSKSIEIITTLSGKGINEDDNVKINKILSMTNYNIFRDNS